MRKKQDEESNFNWSQILIGLITVIVLGGGGYTLFVKDGRVSIEPIVKKDEASSERKRIENFGSPSQNFNVSGGSVEFSNNKSTITNSTVNSNNNSNNKTEQKIENHFQDGSKTVNNYGNPIQSLPNKKPQTTTETDQKINKQQQGPQQQFQFPPVAQTPSFNDANIENYLNLIQQHRDKGVDLAKCNAIQVCLAAYNSWQNQGGMLLSQIDRYIQEKYGRRSELQQEFGNESFETGYMINSESMLQSLKTLFFVRAKTFGSMDFYLKRSLT